MSFFITEAQYFPIFVDVLMNPSQLSFVS